MESIIDSHKKVFAEFLNSLNAAWVVHPEDNLNCTPQTIQFLVAFCQKFAVAKSVEDTKVEFLVRDPRLQRIRAVHFEDPEDKDWVYTYSIYEYEQEKATQGVTQMENLFDRIVLRGPLLHPLNQTVPFQLKFICRDENALIQSECVAQYYPCADPGWNRINSLMRVTIPYHD